jgi:hypothetical protein
MRKILKSHYLSHCAFTLVFLSMFAAIGTNIYLYVCLQQASPIENFSGHIIDPIDLSTDSLIVATGTFNRRVACEMYDFSFQLRNVITKDIIILKPEHLARVPVASMSPAKNIDVDFALHIPTNLYAGNWAPKFTGSYICKKGIFTQNKHQTIAVDSIEVINSQ